LCHRGKLPALFVGIVRFSGIWLSITVLFASLACQGRADELGDSLDARLAAGDLRGINSIMRSHHSAEDQGRFADWLKDKVDSGQGPVSLVLVLAGMSKNLEDGFMYLNYARALILVDAVACEDASAGGSQMMMTMLPAFVSRFQTLISDQKLSASQRALQLEEKTCFVRKLDPWICRYGLGDYGRALHNPPSVPHSADENAEQGQSPAPRTYAANPAWRAKREKMLPVLNQLLQSLDKVPAPAR
jgi:hypothetical protein